MVCEALVAGDTRAQGFPGVYPDGFSGETRPVVQLAAGTTVARYALDHERPLLLTEGLALLAHRAGFVRVRGEAVAVMSVFSLWRPRGEGRQNLVSQSAPAGRGVA